MAKAILILTAALLAGCASLPTGVEMTDDDRAACAAMGCTVWTNEELGRPINLAMQRGFLAGQKNKGLSL